MRPVVVPGIFLLFWVICTSPSFSAERPVAAVQTVPLRQGELSSTITGYGVVNTDPRGTTAINLPYNAQITRIMVTAGEVVRKGTPLMEATISPTDTLRFTTARSDLDFARAELTRTEGMAAQQLATRSQLDQARKNVADAERALAVQKTFGTNRKSTLIAAPFTGLIGMVGAAPGDRVPAGTTIMQLARQDRLRVLIGIEPEEMGRVRPGMPVMIASVFDQTSTLQGRVAKVYGMINPQTRLVDVDVSLGAARKPMLVVGSRVRGVITLGRQKGYLVPRSAVLRDAAGAYLYVVRTGRAHRISVTVSLEHNGMMAVRGALVRGDRVVTLGNYELHDGMGVREERT